MLFKRMKCFIEFIFTRAGYELLEFTNSGLLLLGAWAVLDPNTDLFSNGTAYHVIASLIPENVLGFIFLALGMFKLIALLDGNLKFRQVVSFFITSFWFLLFLGLILGNPTGVLYRWVLFLAFLSVVVAARIKADRQLGIPTWIQKM